ncbi:MAG: hypothetical protein WCR49_05365 [Opitutae bacterium]
MIPSQCKITRSRVPRPTAFNRSVTVLLIMGLGLGQTGCVTSKKYKMAKDDMPPAQPLGWAVTTPPAELALQSLIVYKGPGTWKREAKWDEYVVQFTNHGAVPLTIGTAQLIDILGQPQVPGTAPWSLEKISSSNWDKYGGVGLSLVAGAGVVVIYGGIAMASAWGSFMAAPGAAASAGGAAAALTIIPIAAVVDITAVVIMNHNNKAKVQAEFDRRRLVLPLTLAPGASATGSLFFPMTPGPQRLIVKGQFGEAPLELILPLKPLAGLHLKPKDKPEVP